MTDVEAVDLDEGRQHLKTEEGSNDDKTESFFIFKQKKKNTSKVGSEELRAFIESSDEKVSTLRETLREISTVKKTISGLLNIHSLCNYFYYEFNPFNGYINYINQDFIDNYILLIIPL